MTSGSENLPAEINPRGTDLAGLHIDLRDFNRTLLQLAIALPGVIAMRLCSTSSIFSNPRPVNNAGGVDYS